MLAADSHPVGNEPVRLVGILAGPLAYLLLLQAVGRPPRNHSRIQESSSSPGNHRAVVSTDLHEARSLSVDSPSPKQILKTHRWIMLSGVN